MTSIQQYDPRLSELIWRAIKLRISILSLCIFVLLITWSSLEVGNRKAHEVDTAYCSKIVIGTQNIWMRALSPPTQPSNSSTALPNTQIDSTDLCSEIGDPRFSIQFQRLFLANLIADPKTPEDLRKKQKDLLDTVADYDTKRNEAFRLNLKLSSGYSESSIEVNALSVASASPFIVIGLLVLYFMIGHQEAALRTQLRLQLAGHGVDTGCSPDLFAAKSQHFVSSGDNRSNITPPAFLYSPDRFATLILLLSTIYLLFRVTGEFIAGLSNITDSIFWSYPFWLYTATFSAILILIVSRRHYSSILSQRLHNHSNIFSTQISVTLKRLNIRRNILRSIRKPMTLVLVAIAFGCVFFPFAWRDWGGPIYGYEWFLRHEASNRWIRAAGQEMNLTIFREVRFEIVIALTFLALCALCTYKRILHRTRLRQLLFALRFCGALLVSFLSINYLIFMVILDNESFDLFDLFAKSGASSRGSMIFYSPGIAYWVFTIICMALSAVSLYDFNADDN